MRQRLLLLVVFFAFGFAGCAHDRHHHDHDRGPGPGAHHGHGPPPHAPAHGHRAKMHDRDLAYDSHLGVYVVHGFSGLYWHSGWYYRLVRDRWRRSSSWDGPWHDARWGDIPLGLRGGKDLGHEKGKHKGKGKDWD